MKLLFRLLTFVLLHVALAGFVGMSTLSFSALQKDTITSSIVDANVYENIVPALIDEFERDGESSGQDGLSFEDPEIRSLFIDAIPADFIQTQTEQFIDDVYSWLDDDSGAALTFAIDLTEVRDNLIDNSVDYIQSRAAELPACTSVEQAESADIFNLTCQPPGLTSENLQSEVTAAVTEFEGLEEPILTQDSIDSETPLEQELAEVKDVYNNISPAFYMMSAFLFLAMVGFMLSRLPALRALGLLGRNLLISGLLVAAAALFVRIIAGGRIEALAAEEGQLAQLGTDFGTAYIEQIAGFVLMLGLVMAAIGFVAMTPRHLARLRTSGKHKKHDK